MTSNTPSDAFIVDDNGLPIGHINLDQMQADATMLMYELAATAGDNDATDRVAERWLATVNDHDYFGYVAAGALSLMVRCILAPTLEATDAVGLDLRSGLKRAATDALHDLGGKA